MPLTVSPFRRALKERACYRAVPTGARQAERVGNVREAPSPARTTLRSVGQRGGQCHRRGTAAAETEDTMLDLIWII